MNLPRSGKERGIIKKDELSMTSSTARDLNPKRTMKKSPVAPQDFLKVPPHSNEAEQAVLGGLMLDNEAWDKVCERISETDFYRHEHRLIFTAIAQLAEQRKPFDVLTLAETLKNHNQLTEVGGEAYLFELAKNTPSAANINAYADIVRERSVLRQLLQVANQIADTAFNPEGRSATELLDNAERHVFHIAEQGSRDSGPQSIQHLLTKAVDRIDVLYQNKSAITGLPSGFIDLDKLTSGFQPADLVIVAARPSMGKTMLGINFVENAAIKSGLPVLVFSLEMPGDAIAMRMISSLARINQQNLRTGQLTDDDWARIPSAVSILSEAKLFIDDTPSLSPSEMRSRARRVAREHGQIGLIMVDYLQLMTVPGSNENRTNEVSEISRSLKALAKEMNCPVVALSQLSRALEQRADKRPVMSDLRESGGIEQDADLIAFIYRDEVYNPESPQKGTAEIIIAKHRNGPIGQLRLTFLGQYTKFEDYTPDSYSGNYR
jgi:replicative DNA helicase